MFWLRYTDRDEAGDLVTHEVALYPAPTGVEYPEQKNFKAFTTQDGAVVVQRPRRDARTRRWVWRGHPSTLAPYEALWQLLERLEYRARLDRGLPATVEVWENVSGVGGFDRMEGGERAYTRVKLLQVARTPRSGGGPIVYESHVEFQIEDSGYTAF